MTPSGVHDLVSHGHEVRVQTGAGIGSGFSDADFVAAGARIADDAASVWNSAEMVLKVKEPQPAEFSYLRDDLVLFTYLHLAAEVELTQALCAAGTTSLAYETVQAANGTLPLLAPMSEVAGRLAPLVGAHAMLTPQGGPGRLVSGVPGTRPANVVVLGGGADITGVRAVFEACCHPFHNELSRGERGGRPRLSFEGFRFDNDLAQGLLDLVAPHGRPRGDDLLDRWATLVVDAGGDAPEAAVATRLFLAALLQAVGGDVRRLAELVVPITGRTGRLANVAQGLRCASKSNFTRGG
jgi:hypothetical protein